MTAQLKYLISNLSFCLPESVSSSDEWSEIVSLLMLSFFGFFSFFFFLSLSGIVFSSVWSWCRSGDWRMLPQQRFSGKSHCWGQEKRSSLDVAAVRFHRAHEFSRANVTENVWTSLVQAHRHAFVVVFVAHCHFFHPFCAQQYGLCI